MPVPEGKSEGYVEVRGFELFYRSFVEPKAGTVLCLHGGPGATHDYILPLADLAPLGYRVVFYDQLGCGRSEMPPDTSLFTIDPGVEEVEGVRRALQLGKVHLMGSSYGGALAIAYALKYQAQLASMIVTGGLASVPLTVAEMQRLKSELPAEVQAVFRRYEDSGDYENPKYLKAVEEFYHRYLCRLPRWPLELTHSMEHISRPVYHTMNGPNEFTIIGNLRDWDVTAQLPTIRVPCLITVGRYDEVTPKVAESIHRGIKGSKLMVFEESSHVAMWEERERYIEVVRKFLGEAG
jgi:proline iminopeptidase